MLWPSPVGLIMSFILSVGVPVFRNNVRAFVCVRMCLCLVCLCAGVREPCVKVRMCIHVSVSVCLFVCLCASLPDQGVREHMRHTCE